VQRDLLLDLIQEGTMGLLHALEEADLTQPHFRAYAATCIRNRIWRALQWDWSPLRVPGNKEEDLVRLRQARRRLQGEQEREPDMADLAAVLGLPAAVVGELLVLEQRRQVLSLEKRFPESECSLGELVPVETVLPAPAEAVPPMVEQCLAYLKPCQRQAVTLRYGLDGGSPRSGQQVSLALGKPAAYVGARVSESRQRLQERVPVEVLAALRVSARSPARPVSPDPVPVRRRLYEHTVLTPQQRVRLEAAYAWLCAQGGKLTERRLARQAHVSPVAALAYLSQVRGGQVGTTAEVEEVIA
jgi:RNA polymerase sigma factor (sigma-70 family)